MSSMLSLELYFHFSLLILLDLYLVDRIGIFKNPNQFFQKLSSFTVSHHDLPVWVSVKFF